ncbi:MAG: preprotein translocase subunit YajC [Dehalococcoidia bacterium]
MEVLFLLLVFVLFYFILLKPVLDNQRRKKRDLLDLSPGDRVLTTGGLLATVKRIEIQEEGPTEIVLDLGNNLEVRAVAAAIEQRLSEAPQPVALPQPAKEQPQ